MRGSISLKTSGSVVDVLAPLRGLRDAKGLRALRQGLQEGGDKTRTKVRRVLKTQMGLKNYGTVVKHTFGGIAANHEMAYIIRGEGKGLLINQSLGLRVAAAPPQKRNRLGQFMARAIGLVSARPWGVLHRFKRSYTGRSGNPVARRPDGTVRALRGPSPAKEIVKGRSLSTFEASVATDVRFAIEKRLARLLP